MLRLGKLWLLWHDRGILIAWRQVVKWEWRK